MRIYDILIGYLRESNWNKDGSPSNDDTYYKIISIPANSKALNNVETFVFESDGWCGIEEDYVEDTFEVELMLSIAGH